MKITLKLYATLGELLPSGANANAIEVEVPGLATPHQVIDLYKVPREKAHLILLNGTYISPDDRDKPLIKENDSLAVWPPVAGG
jgi:molybdopterin converting factor small subunit